MVTLGDIRRTIRNITGRKDVNQISDARIDDYINDFYLYDFPERLKTLDLEGFYEFNTIPNVAEYTLSQDYYLVKPPAYVAGYQVGWHQSPDVFYSIWPDLRFLEQVSTGNGGAAYAFTLTNTTILQQSILISAGNENFTDYRNVTGYPNGQLLSSAGGTGTVDYSTGITTVTFGAGVAVGTPIWAQYYRYVASRPRDILFYNYNFKTYNAPNFLQSQSLSFALRPVPDKSYAVRMLSLRRPTAMAAVNSSPEFTEWCNLIAYGAALKIFIEDADWEEYKNMYPIFKEQLNLAQRRALKQLATQRAQTQYSFAMDGSRSMWPLNPIYTVILPIFMTFGTMEETSTEVLPWKNVENVENITKEKISIAKNAEEKSMRNTYHTKTIRENVSDVVNLCTKSVNQKKDIVLHPVKSWVRLKNWIMGVGNG